MSETPEVLARCLCPEWLASQEEPEGDPADFPDTEVGGMHFTRCPAYEMTREQEIQWRKNRLRSFTEGGATGEREQRYITDKDVFDGDD